MSCGPIGSSRPAQRRPKFAPLQEWSVGRRRNASRPRHGWNSAEPWSVATHFLLDRTKKKRKLLEFGSSTIHNYTHSPWLIALLVLKVWDCLFSGHCLLNIVLEFASVNETYSTPQKDWVNSGQNIQHFQKQGQVAQHFEELYRLRHSGLPLFCWLSCARKSPSTIFIWSESKWIWV